MTEVVEIWEKPEAKEIFMLAGWRQWADAGSISSGLPKYLAQLNQARQIGKLKSEGFYIFQFPGTHDLVRPVVKFKQGYPESLQEQRNEFYYSGDQRQGLVYFIGDEPHLDVERYATSLLEASKRLGVKRIIAFGGVYAELPYDKERMVTGIYSLPELKEEMSNYSISLSDYHGGASIGSYLCRRAGEQGIELVAFYAFVPTYEFSDIMQGGNSIRIENDFMAWLGVMRRVKHMLRSEIDLADLEERSNQLIRVMDEKVEELDSASPQLGLREFFTRLSEEFDETTFNPLDDIWEDEIRRLMDKFESEE